MDPLLGAAGAVTAVVGALVATGYASRFRGGARRAGRSLTQSDRAMVALLVALGHDPAKVLVQVVRAGKGSGKTGLRVLGLDHQPIRYYRAAELKRLRRDPEHLRKYAAAKEALA